MSRETPISHKQAAALGWQRVDPRPWRTKLDARWRHEASGWEVHHCGHPTALWPWWARDPAHPGKSTMTHNGKGFCHLSDAFEQIGAVLAGKLVATDSRCGPNTRRITTRGDDSEQER